MRKVWQAKNDECMRAAVAMVLDLDYRAVPRVDTSGADPWKFWGEWSEWLVRKQGVSMRLFPGALAHRYAPDGPWIAIVDSRPASPTRTHAIVCEGARLFHDPSVVRPRKRLPDLVYYGVEIA